MRWTDGSGQLIGWKYTIARSQDVETYDVDGRLTEIRTRAGVTQILSYNGDDRLASVTDSFGHSLTFAYDTNGRLTTLTDPAGGQYTYGYGTYNTINNVQSVTYPDTRVRTYLYNGQAQTNGYQRPYHMTGILDEAGARYATFTYAVGDEKSASTEHGTGVEKYQFGYGCGWPYFTVTDPLGQQRAYDFTIIRGVGKITSISGAPCGASCNNAASVTYDTSGNVSSKTDFKGYVTTYELRSKRTR